MRTVKTQIVFPEELLRELDKAVKSRERSEFVVQAVEEKLERVRLQKALERASGLWKERPEFKTDAKVQQFVQKLRGEETRRRRRLKKAWIDA
jgi:hypothetical protein